MLQKNTHQISDRTQATPYKWDLDRLKRLAKAINIADIEAEKNKDAIYGDDGTAKKDTRSQACPA